MITMNYAVCAAACFAAVCLSSAEKIEQEEDISVKIFVVDEKGAPIKDAHADVSFLGVSNLPTVHKVGLTDDGGGFVAHGRAESGILVQVKKPGYYSGSLERLSPTQNHELKLVLRPVVNPVPLLAKRLIVAAPAMSRQFAYDCELGDFVAPHGKGKTRDLLFSLKVLREIDPYTDYHYELTMTFSNPGDGFQRFDLDSCSDFKGAREAVENGEYEASRTVFRARRPDQARDTNEQIQRGYLFRLRTRTDETGKVISCNFGKAYGDLPDLNIYFNPTPNDRNLEFDPEKNLFKNLEDEEQVHEP